MLENLNCSWSESSLRARHAVGEVDGLAALFDHGISWHGITTCIDRRYAVHREFAYVVSLSTTSLRHCSQMYPCIMLAAQRLQAVTQQAAAQQQDLGGNRLSATQLSRHLIRTGPPVGMLHCVQAAEGRNDSQICCWTMTFNMPKKLIGAKRQAEQAYLLQGASAGHNTPRDQGALITYCMAAASDQLLL